MARFFCGAGVLACCLWASAAHAQWMLFSREEGCVSLQMLVRMERLDRAPVTPEEFADAMRARGHKVTLGLPDGFPADMKGKAVMVRYGESRAPVFLRNELCKPATPR